MVRNIFFQYIEWHFIDNPKGILMAWKNCLKFNFDYWSVAALLKTFFSHWRHYQYSYGKGFDLRRYFEVFGFNMISRALGSILRSALIAAGLASEIFVFLAGLIIFFLWIVLPIFIISGLWFGIKALL